MIKLPNAETQVRFLRFGVVGFGVMILQVGSFWLFEQWWSISVAFVAAYVLAVTTHYSLNRFWALRSSRSDVTQQGGEYLVTAIGSFVSNYLLFNLLLKEFGLAPIAATLCASVTTAVVVFLILNFRVFRA